MQQREESYCLLSQFTSEQCSPTIGATAVQRRRLPPNSLGRFFARIVRLGMFASIPSEDDHHQRRPQLLGEFTQGPDIELCIVTLCGTYSVFVGWFT